MKSCPYCSQQIQDAAIKCRFCQNWLVPPPPAYAPSPVAPLMQPARRTSGMATAGIVLGWIGIGTMCLVIGLIFLGFWSEQQEKKQKQNSNSQHAQLVSPQRESVLEPHSALQFPKGFL